MHLAKKKTKNIFKSIRLVFWVLNGILRHIQIYHIYKQNNKQ